MSAAIYLLPKVEPGANWQPTSVDTSSPTGLKSRRPGGRAKPFVADWNDDGKPDLLVGDFLSVQGEEPKLTATQIKQRDVLRARSAKIAREMSPYYDKFYKHAMAKAGFKDYARATKAQQKKYGEIYSATMRKDMAFQALQKGYSDVSQKLRKLEPVIEMTGFVWVYLRKP